nr:hypothetical protein [Tanacetum cinerariifolium]
FNTVANQKQQHEINVAISNSFGIGGHNSVVAFSAFVCCSVVGEENLLIKAEIEELDDVTMNEDVEANVNLEPGGTQYVHVTSNDFKNHIRDVNAFIRESDAQMLINKMENRKNFVSNFTFHYLVKNSELVAMFWADEVAKCNYKEFGDIISFDATFRTNKYDMVFVPFTGTDNHLKCVNFGSGMLLKEDTEAYIRLLTSFMTIHEKQPIMVVTDQDGAMKRAIEAVLTESKHRLCMWHIMQKVPAKIFPEKYDETEFKERFGKLVWNMFIETLEFKGKWSKLVEDFGLQNHKWMRKMFDLRHMWLPTYFIHSPLFGLMRTTSRFESKDAFFKNFTNRGSTLVNFMMCFEFVMERQCYRQEVSDFRMFDSAPKLHTKLTIEIHACKVYTRIISLLIQKEIYEGYWACKIQEFKKKKVVRSLRDLIPPALRRNTNRYGEKDEAIEKLTNEANFVVDECLFLLRKDKEQLKQFVEKLENIKKEIQVKVPNPPS